MSVAADVAPDAEDRSATARQVDAPDGKDKDDGHVTKFETLALIASGLNAASLVPQIIRIWKMGNADQISPLYLIVAVVASLLWLAFGIANGLRPNIISAIMMLILYGIIVALKVYYSLKPRSVDVPIDALDADVVP